MSVFHPVPLADLLERSGSGHMHILEATHWPHERQAGKIIPFGEFPFVLVDVPPLGEFAQGAFGQQPTRTTSVYTQWDTKVYGAIPPIVCTFRDVFVHSQAGILVFDETVIDETLWHTRPEVHGYDREGDRISIKVDGAQIISGKTLSLLGVADNYFHSVIDGVARMALLSEETLANVDHILLPAGGMGQSELVRLYDIPPHISIRYVSASETFRVDTLIFPFTLHGLFLFHPRMNAFFDRVLTNLPRRTETPKYLYIDRRGASLRPLINEDDVVAGLEGLGFHVVRLETMSQVEQINLFRGAQLVVSPHGAGLTNLCFSTPGTAVVELFMDSYVNWCYRAICAVRGVKYDAVLGHAVGDWQSLQDGSNHGQGWEIRAEDVISTVKRLMN